MALIEDDRICKKELQRERERQDMRKKRTLPLTTTNCLMFVTGQSN